MNAVFVRIFVVYDSKYGNTKRTAEKVLEGIREIEGVESAIPTSKKLTPPN